MRKTPLFSTYKQGENRVTSSMLAVFERIDLGVVERLLATATGESAFQMVTFANQPGADAGGTVPDARIAANFSYWFEVKTKTEALTAAQLTGHLQHLKAGPEERLLVLTPDAGEPSAIAEVDDQRVLWLNFRSLSQAIDEVLGDDSELVSEQTRLLLRELHALFEEERLLDAADVVVVAARLAYGEYLDCSAYVCQPQRSFRPGIGHIGFYVKGEIRPEIPRILVDEDNVLFTKDEASRRKASGDSAKQRVGDVIDVLLDSGQRTAGNSHRVFVLSAPDSDETVRLEAPIVNTTVDKGGKPWAWTLGQRYTSLSSLTAPGVTTTDQLTAANE